MEKLRSSVAAAVRDAERSLASNRRAISQSLRRSSLGATDEQDPARRATDRRACLGFQGDLEELAVSDGFEPFRR